MEKEEEKMYGVCPTEGGLLKLEIQPEVRFFGLRVQKSLAFIENCDQVWWKEITDTPKGFLIGTKLTTKIPMCKKTLSECPHIQREHEDGDDEGLNIFSKKPIWQQAK